MTAPEPAPFEQRVLVLARAKADLSLARQAVEKAELKVELCPGMDDLCRQIAHGAAALILEGDILDEPALSRLQETLAPSPPWSDLALLILAPRHPGGAAGLGADDAAARLSHVIWLERPVQLSTLTSILRSTWRDRRRQFEIRRFLELEHQAAPPAQSLAEQMESFTYSISHDLRAPLRAVRGFAQALSEDYSAALDDAGREYLTRIEQGAERMDRLIQDLLQYSRVGAAGLTLSPVDLEPLIQHTLQQLGPDIRARHASIELRKPLPSVLGHEPTLEQVVTSLLSNAIKFVPPATPPRVRIWAETNGPHARLWIADNGIGIDPAHHQRIFGVFERLHGAETYPGTGIGLAIVAKGMERMGGKVGVESAPGKGSRFWIELSRAEVP
jgi:signal transduction histidine kinase